MTLISIDASTKSSGLSVFIDNKLYYYTCITASGNDVIKRIITTIDKINEIFKLYKPDKIILEEVRPDQGSTNPKTMKALMWLQAAIVFYCYLNYNSTTIDYIYPSEWRSKCGIKTGKGILRDKLKQESINFVKNKYNIDVNDDIADSICIGYAYIKQLTENEKINFI